MGHSESPLVYEKIMWLLSCDYRILKVFRLLPFSYFSELVRCVSSPLQSIILHCIVINSQSSNHYGV